MSIWKLLPAMVHGVADFGSGAALILVSLIVAGSGRAVGTGVVLGGVLILVSLLTDYPLGVFKVIPFVVHSAGDYLGAAALLAAPFVLGFADSDGGLAAFYVGMGATLVAVSLIPDYSDPAPPPCNALTIHSDAVPPELPALEGLSSSCRYGIS